MAIIQTHNLNIGYIHGKQQKLVLGNINLNLKEGELVCMLGANGKGKSTLLRTLSGVQPPLSGEIEIAGKPINQITKRELAKILGLVYTDHISAGGLTVTELVELGRHPHTGFLGRLSADDHEIVNKAINNAGVAPKKDSFIADLSDGERQKAMIAKALAQETPIIFLDEPTAFLDIASKIETMRLLHSLARTQNKAILLSSHDVSQALILADKLLIIDKNCKIIFGTTEDLILSGIMNDLFDSSSIDFDIENGNFTSKDSCTIKINVSSNNRALLHWLENALRRNGYLPCDNQGESISVHIVSPSEIRINSTDSATQTVNSIANLLIALKELNIQHNDNN